jgi:hypothetical protein
MNMSEEKAEAIPGGSRLRLKEQERKEPGLIQEPEELRKLREKKRKPKKKKKPAKSSRSFGLRFWGQTIGTFVVSIALLGGYLYHQSMGLQILTPSQAEMVRGIAMVSVLALLILEAFKQDMMQGVICLFLFPYAFIYGLIFADAGPLRGITLAVLMFFGAEVYFTPDNALVPKVSRSVNAWIQQGQNRLIDPDRPDAGFEN